jgi:hypothetical protein
VPTVFVVLQLFVEFSGHVVTVCVSVVPVTQVSVVMVLVAVVVVLEVQLWLLEAVKAPLPRIGASIMAVGWIDVPRTVSTWAMVPGLEVLGAVVKYPV